MFMTEDGRHDILYVDYGNTALLPGKDLATTAFHIWNLPPMSKPFRLTGNRLNVQFSFCALELI